MDNTAKSIPIMQMPLNEVRIAGKIQSSRRHEQNYFTLIIAPAKDEYSSPSRFEIRSKSKLGEKDDVLNLRCSLGGTVRNFPYTDKETGEKKTGNETRTWLDVIE